MVLKLKQVSGGGGESTLSDKTRRRRERIPSDECDAVLLTPF